MPSFSASSSITDSPANIAGGRAGRAVGGRLRLVDDHVVAVDLDVGDVVGREDAVHAAADRRAGEGAGLVGQVGLAGGDACRRSWRRS